MKSPLNGKTILITRPKNQAGELMRRLKSNGARVIAAPTIRIVPPHSWAKIDGALRRIGEYDIVIFTSTNAVTIFFDRMKRLLGKIAPAPKAVYAIGPETARTVKAHGWRGAQIPRKFEGEALAQRVRGAKHARILIPRAKVARDVLPKTLRRRGAEVDVVEAYRTVGDPAGLRTIRRAARSGQADIVTFTSSSTAEQFAAALGRTSLKKFFSKATAASIGPVTSATLRRLGVRNIIEARDYTSGGVARAILDHAKSS